MFTVIVETEFSAAHRLVLSNGGSEPLHRHNWQVAAAVGAGTLDRMGLAMDFVRLRAMVEQVINPMRNGQLETMECFSGTNASAENVALYIYERLSALLPPSVSLSWVEIAEAPGCKVRYCR